MALQAGYLQPVGQCKGNMQEAHRELGVIGDVVGPWHAYAADWQDAWKAC
jgi:hypothetical protein